MSTKTHLNKLLHFCIKQSEPSEKSLTSAIVVWTELEAMITLALVRAQSVDASPIVAYIRIPLTLVDIHAAVPVPSKSESKVANTLKASLKIVASPVAADPRSLVALVDVDAASLTDAKLVSSRASTFEASLKIDALGVS